MVFQSPLPNKIVEVEVENLRKQGVHFQTDTIVGKTISVEELKQNGFKGIFVGSGAGLPNFMGIPGENSINILSSNEYLTRVNLMDAANPDTDTPIIIGKRCLLLVVEILQWTLVVRQNVLVQMLH